MPSTTAETFAATFAARSPMPMAILKTSGRFFSSVALRSLAAFASAAPAIVMPTCAGVHSILPAMSASQFALQSALISGGFTSPVHFGSLNSAEQPPVHVPSHFASAFIWHEPPHLPLHSPLTVPPSHLPSQVPAHAAFESLPSHLPLHVPEHEPLISASHEPLHWPSHFAPPCTSQVPLHCASHLPDSLPGSHSTFAEPGFTFASHLPAQSAYALRLAWHFGSFTTSASFAFAPSFAF